MEPNEQRRLAQDMMGQKPMGQMRMTHHGDRLGGSRMNTPTMSNQVIRDQDRMDTMMYSRAGQMDQMVHLGQMNQMGYLGQMTQMGKMDQLGQMAQMGQMDQMTQMGKMTQ